MTRFSKTFLLLGTALLALNACSGGKGPGDIGSKDDIVVRNNGMPGAQTAMKTDGEDFTSTVEQAEAMPAPEVAMGEPLPDSSPAVEAAVAQHEAAKAPIAPDAASPADLASAPVSETRPLDNIAPTVPVTESVTPPPVADAPVYVPPPAAPAVVPATPVASAPVVSTPAPYPLDPNAPYSPKAVAAANEAASGVVASTAIPATSPAVAAPVPASGVNFADPAIIRSAQAALKLKGLYKGAESGTIDSKFLNALTIYQSGNQLPVGGLNEPTLRYLGVIE